MHITKQFDITHAPDISPVIVWASQRWPAKIAWASLMENDRQQSKPKLQTDRKTKLNKHA